jgi:hypothetical protein
MFVYAPSARISLDMAQVYVYLDDSLIEIKKASSYNWNIGKVKNISIATDKSSKYIKFCGNSNLKGQGVVISSVSFKKVATHIST